MREFSYKNCCDKTIKHFKMLNIFGFLKYINPLPFLFHIFCFVSPPVFSTHTLFHR